MYCPFSVYKCSNLISFRITASVFLMVKFSLGEFFERDPYSQRTPVTKAYFYSFCKIKYYVTNVAFSIPSWTYYVRDIVPFLNITSIFIKQIQTNYPLSYPCSKTQFLIVFHRVTRYSGYRIKSSLVYTHFNESIFFSYAH